LLFGDFKELFHVERFCRNPIAGDDAALHNFQMLHVVLVEPEIPPNTGNIARLCLAAGARLHLVEPLGFSLDEKALRRAGMDYWHLCDVKRWSSLDELQANVPDGRFFYFTTKSSKVYWNEDFRDEDYLVFGRESRGLPESLLRQQAVNCLKIPMLPEARSLNLATAVGIALYEAKRHTRGLD
jgi:tRNA (cytidine/uridine-2'-O-)-methyltransferase